MKPEINIKGENQILIVILIATLTCATIASTSTSETTDDESERAAGQPDAVGKLASALLGGANKRTIESSNATLTDDELLRCLVPVVPIDPLTVMPTLYFFSSRHSHQEQINKSYLAQFPFDGLDNDNQSRIDSNFNIELIKRYWSPNDATYILIHGFMASWSSSDWQIQIKDQLFEETIRNPQLSASIFIVDWSEGSNPPLGAAGYARSVASTHLVAQMLAHFFTRLLNIEGHESADTIATTMSHIHVVGHSLGAHIGGMMGKQMRANFNNYNNNNNRDHERSSEIDFLLGRITALDPAGPCFSSSTHWINDDDDDDDKDDGDHKPKVGVAQQSQRLTSSDARVVIALHTDTDKFGINENVADYDVYVNGGLHQPGCPSLKQKLHQVLKFQLDDFVRSKYSITCSHSYAHQSITKAKMDQQVCQLVAYKCQSWSAFQSGECGVCHDNQSQCVMSHLEPQLLGNSNRRQFVNVLQLVSLIEPPVGKSFLTQDENNSNRSIRRIDYDDDVDNDDRINETNAKHEPRYYMQTDNSNSACVISYQLVVEFHTPIDDIKTGNDCSFWCWASDKSLDLRLKVSLFQDQRQLRKDMQINHRIKRDHNDEQTNDKSSFYWDQANNELHVPNYGQSTGNNQANSTMDALTSLVTFKLHDFNNSSSLNDDQNYVQELDSPLVIDRANIWADDERVLDAIARVTINFMSSTQYNIRQEYSTRLCRGNKSDQRLELSLSNCT